MSRSLTTAAANAAAAGVVRPVLLVDLEFSDGTVRYTTAVMEGTELEANRIIVGLNGIPSANLSLAIGQTYQNRPATVYLGFLDANYALVADPFVAFKGRMDSMDIELGKTARIQIGIESRLVDWDKARIRRYTNEDQQNFFAGDKGLEFMSEMVDKQLVWGRT